MSITVRRVTEADQHSWSLLWDAYLDFAGASLEEGVTENTWQRMLAPDVPMWCWLAEIEGRAVGFALIVLHEGAWVTTPVCYLEDLFVAEGARGAGVGKALLQFLRIEAAKEGWSRVYWMTRESSEARYLYDKMATIGDFVRYTMNM